jgi:hypothetical protein
MTTGQTQKTAKTRNLFLLKIPYAWDTKCQIETIPVESCETAKVYATEYLDKLKEQTSPHYFMLIEGSIIPTAEWISSNDFVHHP